MKVRIRSQNLAFSLYFFLCFLLLSSPSFRARGGNQGGTEALFGVVHFAGEVIYDSTEFVEKNRDEVPPALHDLVISSNDRWSDASRTSQPSELHLAASCCGQSVTRLFSFSPTSSLESVCISLSGSSLFVE